MSKSQSAELRPRSCLLRDANTVDDPEVLRYYSIYSNKCVVYEALQNCLEVCKSD
jgi:hypothetical protein